MEMTLATERGRAHCGRPGAPAVELVSANLHAGYDADGCSFDVTAACRKLTGDIVVAQEAWRIPRQPDLLADWARQRGARLIRADLRVDCDLRSMGIAPEDARGAWGLALITTLPVLAYEVAHLGRSPGDPANRAAQIATVEVPGGGKLRVANVHLSHRFTSPVQLIRLVLRLARSGAPTVIAGDFNMPAPFTSLAAGYSPAVSGKTYPALRPVVQLDHILVGRGVAARGGVVLPPIGSDHLPIRARLRLA